MAAGGTGVLGPELPGRWLTVRREKDPGAIADKTLSWKRCLANRADDVAAQDDPGRRPGGAKSTCLQAREG